MSMKDKDEIKGKGNYLTVKEAMSELKVCRNTLWKHIRSGRLIAYRVGNLIRIPHADLESFVKSGGRIRSTRLKHRLSK
jgi:excisionase family DNA binding protein